jgi:hypothetical protein
MNAPEAVVSLFPCQFRLCAPEAEHKSCHFLTDKTIVPSIRSVKELAPQRTINSMGVAAVNWSDKNALNVAVSIVAGLGVESKDLLCLSSLFSIQKKY